MKVRLLRDVRPYGRTGEIVEVSPGGLDLLSLGMAVPVREIREQIETPEKPMAVETAVKIPVKFAAKTQQKAAKAAKKEKEK